MGNAWIAPDEQTLAYGPMLYQLVSSSLVEYKHTLLRARLRTVVVYDIVIRHCCDRLLVRRSLA